MRLIDDWRRVLTRAWSVRLGILAGMLQGTDIVLQITIGQLGEVSWALRVLAGLSAMAAFVSRFVAQPRTLGGDDQDK